MTLRNSSSNDKDQLQHPARSNASSSKASRKRHRPSEEDAAQDQQPSKDNDNFPAVTRDCSNLWAAAATVQCAMLQRCIPCAYKIACFDVALDTEFCRSVPNQRPENCPRSTPPIKPNDATVASSHDSPSKHASEVILGYRPGMRILTVGDGDFSFSLALARLLAASSFRESKTTKATKPTQLVATTYESLATLRQVYPNLDETLAELKQFGVVVVEKVDATRLVECLPQLHEDNNHLSTFHRIIWNFPCTAIAGGQDGQNDAMEENKQLVRKFVANAQCLLTESGEIHMNHKTKPPYDQWRLERVALEAPSSDAGSSDAKGESAMKRNTMRYAGRVVLDKCLLHPYTPRKALCRKSFPCHDACIYIFSKDRPSSTFDGDEVVNDASDSMPPTIPVDRTDGDSSQTHLLSSSTIVPVTRDLIRYLRSKILERSQGTLARKRKQQRN